MDIHFADEADETCQRIIDSLAGYRVGITANIEDESLPSDHPARFDAEIVKVDPDSTWTDAIIVREYMSDTDSGPTGEPFSVRVERIHVY